MPNLSLDQSLSSQQGFGNVTTMIAPFFISSSTPITNSVGSFLFYGTTVALTRSLGVSEYNNHVFQASITGSAAASGSFTVLSSIDGVNWNTEFSLILINSSSVVRVANGRRQYFQASYSGSFTGSLYLLSGQ